MNAHKKHNTVAIILAGGSSRRMGEDKAFIYFFGKALVLHVAERLSTQCDQLLFSSNRDADNFSTLGITAPIIADKHIPPRGPLEGILAGLKYLQSTHSDAQYLISSPVDCPIIPKDLVERLLKRAEEKNAECCSAEYEGRGHYLSALWSTKLTTKLEQHLSKGRYDVRSFMKTIATEKVDFSDYASDPFMNINTKNDLLAAEKLSQ